MIDLPVGLASWAPQLAVLPSDLALSLAPWVGRLALAVGPLAATQTRRSGEPDGYSGLSRRGSYERLLTSEWGIADLFPDEFLRRAGAGEHLFLDLARSEPHGALRSVAIVSAGPAQLGAPRLAHIAGLIVLARRAAAAGASFAWGVLEDSDHRLHDAVDEASIQQLLGARTAVAADADAFTRWLEMIGGDRDLDFWFIGSDDDAGNAAHAGASTLVVRDVLEPNTRALDIEIQRRGREARARLELPAPDHCARLLRDPFSRGGGSTPKVAAANGPALDVRFAPGARKLIVRLADGSFETWPIPTSPKDKLGSPRHWTAPRNRTVIALGIGKRSVLAATATLDDTTAIELHYSSNEPVRVMLPNGVATALAECLATNKTPRIRTCALVRMREQARSDLIVDVLGRLLVVPGFSLWPRPGTVFSALPFNGAREDRGGLALATAFFSASVVWAEQHENGQVHVIEGNSNGNRRVAIVGAREEPDVQFGFAFPSSESWGVVSAAWDAEHRRVAAQKLPHTTLKSVVPVVGVCLRDGVPGLLTRPHPYRLAWVIGERRELLPTASAPIASVAVSPSQPYVAWVTEAGEVVVYSMQHNAVLLRRVSEGDQ
jgi:hypothetical protein